MLLFHPSARAQKEFSTWCFGDGIDHNSAGRPIGTKIKVCFTETGTLPADTCGGTYSIAPGFSNATISDPAGNLILYTDGLVINNRRHRLMANGLLDAPRGFPDVPYERLVQSVAATPGPDGRYYVFYWTLFRENGVISYNLTYAVVDARLQNGDGAVVAKGQVLTRTAKARVTVVRHRNNRDFWVITRDLNAQGFLTFPLTRAGVGTTPVASLAGQAARPTTCELKAAPNGRRLVCSGTLSLPGNTSAEYVCLYDFDNATGTVSHEQAVRRLPFLPAAQNVHTASFSPNSQLLYTIEPNPNFATEPLRYNDLWQYDLRRSTPAEIEQSRVKASDVPPPPGPGEDAGGFGLQLAPDGTLWSALFYNRHHYDPVLNLTFVGPVSAAIVRQPDVVGAGCGFVPEAYPYRPGQYPVAFLPNLITNMLYAQAAINKAMGRPDDSVRFWASSAGLPAALRWDFDDPSDAANTAVGGQVAHRYTHGGTYPVRLTLADGRVVRDTVAVLPSAVDFTGATVFTPNDDGYNDEFVPVRAALPHGHLRVFSRWGQLVYESIAPSLHWNGYGASGGEYFYQIDYPNCNGQQQHQRGVVTLIR